MLLNSQIAWGAIFNHTYLFAILFENKEFNVWQLCSFMEL